MVTFHRPGDVDGGAGARCAPRSATRTTKTATEWRNIFMCGPLPMRQYAAPGPDPSSGICTALHGGAASAPTARDAPGTDCRDLRRRRCAGRFRRRPHAELAPHGSRALGWRSRRRSSPRRSGRPAARSSRASGVPTSTAPLAEALDARKEAIYRDLIREHFPAMDGAVELIDALDAAGFRLGVGSSGPPENVEALDARALGSHGPVRRDRDGSRRHARQARPAGVPDRGRAPLGLPAARCIVVEDAPVGIAAARAAGMASVALVGTVAADRLAAADLVVESLREVDAPRLSALLVPPS